MNENGWRGMDFLCVCVWTMDKKMDAHMGELPEWWKQLLYGGNKDGWLAKKCVEHWRGRWTIGCIKDSLFCHALPVFTVHETPDLNQIYLLLRTAQAPSCTDYGLTVNILLFIFGGKSFIGLKYKFSTWIHRKLFAQSHSVQRPN